MASKAFARMSLLLALNLLFFTLVTSHNVPCPPPPHKKTPPTPKTPSTPKTPTPSTPSTPKITPSTPKTPTPSTPTPSTPSTPTPSTPSTPKKATCPKDTLKLGACANVLKGLVNVVVGTPSKSKCCSLIGGLADLDAAVCLCTAIKAKVLGINLNVPVSLSLLLNYCGKKVPSGYQCS